MTSHLAVETPDSVVLRWPSEAANEWVIAFLDAALRDENVLAVVPIGSAIRADVPSDDLDIVVICKRKEGLDHRAPIEIDIRTFDMDEVTTRLDEGNELLAWAIKFGNPLLDRERYWKHLVANWADRVPLPDPLLAGRRADALLRHVRTLEKIGDRPAAAEMRLSYLTLKARAKLSELQIFPTSRPELPQQLREIGEGVLADALEDAIRERYGLARDEASPVHPGAARILK